MIFRQNIVIFASRQNLSQNSAIRRNSIQNAKVIK